MSLIVKNLNRNTEHVQELPAEYFSVAERARLMQGERVRRGVLEYRAAA